MLYNIKLDRIIGNADCFNCEFFDKQNLKCEGFGKACFEYDELTDTLLDAFSGLPLKTKEKEGNKK